MIAIDTDEKLNCFLNGLENEEFIIFASVHEQRKYDLI